MQQVMLQKSATELEFQSNQPLNDVTVSDIIPNSLDIQSTDDRCSLMRLI